MIQLKVRLKYYFAYMLLDVAVIAVKEFATTQRTVEKIPRQLEFESILDLEMNDFDFEDSLREIDQTLELQSQLKDSEQELLSIQLRFGISKLATDCIIDWFNKYKSLAPHVRKTRSTYDIISRNRARSFEAIEVSLDHSALSSVELILSSFPESILTLLLDSSKTSTTSMVDFMINKRPTRSNQVYGEIWECECLLSHTLNFFFSHR